MFRINIFKPYLIILRYINASLSPIDRERFNREFKERSRDETIYRPNRSGTSERVQDETWYLVWAFLNLRTTYQLIKRYHQVGDRAMIFYLLHFAFLIHLAVKAVVHTFITSKDEQNSKYYPYWTHMMSSPSAYHHMFVGFVMLILWLRIKSFLLLIEKSIVNAKTYKELSTTQINNTYLANLNLTMKEWFELCTLYFRHKKRIESSQIAYKHHLEFNQTLQKNYAKYQPKDMLYYWNPIDFDECYLDLKAPTRKRLQKDYSNWFGPRPMIRLSPLIMSVEVGIAFVGSFIICVVIVIDLLTIIFMDLNSVYKYTSKSFPEVKELFFNFIQHYSELFYVIRFVEVMAIMLLRVPLVYETISVCHNAFIITARLTKVVEVLEDNLKLCHAIRYNLMRPEIRVVSNNLDLEGNKNYQNLTYDSSYNRIKLNKQVCYNVGLVRLLYVEFLQLRQTHQGFLNACLTGYGLCMSYATSILLSQKEVADYILNYVIVASCLIPTLITLLIFAEIERRFKQIARILSSLIVNRAKELDSNSINLIVTASESLILTEDRAVVIGGVYA